jgi:hypothetical protein
MEACCVICAVPLAFCAFGLCHHQTMCTNCAGRLRILKEDRNCPMCKQDCPQVFVTRYMDQHTRRIPQDAWAKLKVRRSLARVGAQVTAKLQDPCAYAMKVR